MPTIPSSPNGISETRRLGRAVMATVLLSATIGIAAAPARADFATALVCTIASRGHWETGRLLVQNDAEAAGGQDGVAGSADDPAEWIAVDLESGDWSRHNPMSAALVSDGGMLAVLRDGDGYSHEWVGQARDGLEHMRIATNRPHLPFLFLDRHGLPLAGTCRAAER